MKKMTKKKFIILVIAVFFILLAIVQFLYTGGYIASDDYEQIRLILVVTVVSYLANIIISHFCSED